MSSSSAAAGLLATSSTTCPWRQSVMLAQSHPATAPTVNFSTCGSTSLSSSEPNNWRASWAKLATNIGPYACGPHVAAARVHPRHPHAGGGGQVLEATGGGVPVHPGAEDVAQDRPMVAAVDGAVDGPGHRWRQRNEYHLATLPRTRRTRWPCSSPRSAMLAPQASKIRRPSRPSLAMRAKSFGFADRQAW